jgi:nitrite reductase (NADH) large subunit
MKENLIVVGNGMAGIRLLDEILKRDPNRYEITVFGDEPQLGYDRILLSSVLGGEKSPHETVIHDRAWYQTHGIHLHCGVEITQIDRAARQVVTADGQSFDYSRLVLATGSWPAFLKIPGCQLKGVLGFRTMADVDFMLTTAQQKKKAVVIGAGLLGLEAAYGLAKRGMNVTVVHIYDTIMERQLDSPASDMLLQTLKERGLDFLLGKDTAELLGNSAGEVEAIQFKDGERIPADLVVMAIGIRPRIELAQKAQLNCRRGIIVDDFLKTSDRHILALGECVEHREQTYGLVAPLYEMAKVCAEVLTARPSTTNPPIPSYQGSLTSAKLKVTGVEVFSAGLHLGNSWTENITFHDASLGVYKKLVVQNNQLVGIVLYGEVRDASWYFQFLKEKKDISPLRDHIIFGPQAGPGTGKSQSLAAVMTADMEVCGCNGVCKGSIVQTILQNKLTTLDEVRAHTKASASCGNCTGTVREILALTLGPEVEIKPVKEVLCKCTEHSTEEVRQQIRENQWTHVSFVFKNLAWKNEDGCSTCRPALNYYLLCEFPSLFKDDPQSRLVNERVHANIQKDGTYSVVPRIWGGVTTPQQLRAIADVAEKFKVPTVKITGGQRIDLLGIQKKDLPAVWKDLNSAGMVSGHAYGKALRTVKTCVGSEWCRFGVQDSTTLGIRMEEMTWGSWTPAKVKMAVSGCPRNCAESTIKDLGVIAVDSGWELHVGGNGGIKVRVSELLCKVATQEEVLEYCGAFMQLYRNQARYRERTAHWIERVGLAFVQEQIVLDVKNRKQLHQEFLESQKYAQVDPWSQKLPDSWVQKPLPPLPTTVTQPSSKTSTGHWLHVCHLNELPKQSSHSLKVDNKRLAVFRTTTGDVYALEDRCPHKKGPLSEGLIHGDYVACPLHDWNIELKTGQAMYPDKGCVSTYPVRIEEGNIYVKLSALPSEAIGESVCIL